jgi:hypothetical protein
MTTTKTPGMLYYVRQQFPGLAWVVVQLPADQGRAMRERGEPRVYDTPAQAHKVASAMNKRRQTD